MARQTEITNVINKSTVELTGMPGSFNYKNRPLGTVMADDPRIFNPENVKDAHEHSIGIEIIKENVREIGNVNTLHNDVEAMMWPTMFPYGKGGFKKI